MVWGRNELPLRFKQIALVFVGAAISLRKVKNDCLDFRLFEEGSLL